MIVVDTNILIEILKANKQTIEIIQTFDEELVISSVSVMELYYGAINKAELKKLEKFVANFRVEHLNEEVSRQSTALVKTYAKSHGLDIPDCLIAATALVLGGKLFTYNVKDFRYIAGLVLVNA